MDLVKKLLGKQNLSGRGTPWRPFRSLTVSSYSGSVCSGHPSLIRISYVEKVKDTWIVKFNVFCSFYSLPSWFGDALFFRQFLPTMFADLLLHEEYQQNLYLLEHICDGCWQALPGEGTSPVPQVKKWIAKNYIRL